MQVNGVSFSYGKQEVLKDISFAMKEGSVTTILGANGSGKSTLFYLMTKNLPLITGEILLEGKDIKRLKLKEFAKKVAIVNQTNSIQGDIQVEKLVGYGRTPFLSFLESKRTEDERLIDWAMEITNVKKYRGKPLSSLSGGQRQRVWIAMALAQNTKILLLDEPTTYLDIRYQLEILDLIRRLNREFGITILMVLHDVNQAIRYSDEVIGLKDGRIVAQGVPREVVSPEFMEEIYGVRLDVAYIEKRMYVLNA